MTDVTDFIGAAIADKPVAALKAFGAAMEPKITDALNTRYDEVSNQVFNPSQEVADDVEDVELEAADEVVDEVEVEEPEAELETEMEEPQDV